MGLWKKPDVTLHADVKTALARALADATARRHHGVDVAHLLRALLACPAVETCVTAMKVDVAAAREALDATLAELPRSRWLSFRPLSAGYEDLLVRGIAHAIASARTEVTAPFLVAHLLAKLDEAPAARLAKVGFTRLAFTQVVAHGAIEPPPPPASGVVSVVFCDDPFTTMEMVVEVLRDVFDVTSEARTLMLRVHHMGRAVVVTMDAALAKTKIDAAHARAGAAGMPLRVLAEPVAAEPRDAAAQAR